jgi:two-component system chemotaxis sensor kinase CheA
VELFLTEGREHVAELNTALAELDVTPASDASVAVAFRAVHSIKGMAAAMGYTQVTDTAHSLESLLDSVRRREERVTPPLLQLMLEEADALETGIEQAVRPATEAPTTSARVGDDVQRADASVTRAAYVRVRARRLDTLMDLVGELEIARGGLERELLRVRDDRANAAFTHASRLLTTLRDEIIEARMVPVGQVFDRFPRLVRETARMLGKSVDFVLEGSDIELDRSMLDRIGDPVMHLLRNALDHGIESPDEREWMGKGRQGRLTLSATREADHVLVRVTDDGRGVDQEPVLRRARAMGLIAADATELDAAELLRILATPGFSTAASVTSVSGRGVGLDAVDAAVRTLGGSLQMETWLGRGTAITLKLPLTVAMVRALIARVGGELFAIPFTHVHETVELRSPQAGDWTSATIHDEDVPVISLRDRFGLPPNPASSMKGVTVAVRGRRAALLVDDFVGQQDVVVKRYDPPCESALTFAGATVMGDGVPALIIDVNSLL